MSDTLLIALLSFAGTAIGSLSGIFASQRLTLYRLKKLEEKVELHNHLVERVCRLEARMG